jgi:hypothetical protein
MKKKLKKKKFNNFNMKWNNKIKPTKRKCKNWQINKNKMKLYNKNNKPNRLQNNLKNQVLCLTTLMAEVPQLMKMLELK